MLVEVINAMEFCSFVAISTAVTRGISDQSSYEHSLKNPLLAYGQPFLIVTVRARPFEPHQLAAPHGTWLANRALPRLFPGHIVCLAWPRPFVVGVALMAAAPLLEVPARLDTGSPSQFSGCTVRRRRGTDGGSAFARATRYIRIWNLPA